MVILYHWQRFADDDPSWWDAALSGEILCFILNLKAPFG